MEVDEPAMLANMFWLKDHGYELVDISKPLWYDTTKTTEEYELREADGTPLRTCFASYNEALILAMKWLVEEKLVDPNEPLRDEWKAGAAMFLKGGYLETNFGLKPL